MLTIRPASDADIPAIQSLLYDAVDRAEAMGRPMWQREHVAWEVISQKYPASTFRLAVLDGETVGCMALVMYDPEIWPVSQEASSSVAIWRSSSSTSLRSRPCSGRDRWTSNRSEYG